MKITVIEDEKSIRDLLKLGLSKTGDVSAYSSGEEFFLDIDNINQLNIAIIDIMLPGRNGFEVCKKLRELRPNAGIIMLTALSQVNDRVDGLKSGADDYLVKPFSLDELKARIEALSRRLDIDNTDVLVSGNFKIDKTKKYFFENDILVNLTTTEYKIMELLLENKNSLITRDKFLDLIWGVNYVGSYKIIDVNIQRIRKKIKDDNIKTIRGEGYIWED